MVTTSDFAHQTTVHYVPHQRAQMGWAAMFRIMSRDCIVSRDLILQLFKRDYLMMHKKSFLGVGWHVASPIMGILSWLLMNSTGILNPGDTEIPYPAYLLLSTTIWGLFMQTSSNVSRVLEVASGFIHQVGFPHHVMLIKQWLETLTNFLMAFAVALVGLLFLGVYPSWGIVLFPMALIPMVLLASSIGLALAVMKVVSPDVQRAVGFVLGFWMYITPVVFAPRVADPFFQKCIDWNPMTHLLVGARELFIRGSISNLHSFVLVTLGCIVLFLVSWRTFYITEERVIEKLI